MCIFFIKDAYLGVKIRFGAAKQGANDGEFDDHVYGLRRLTAKKL